MSRKDFIFTSESVSEGHPDKLCDLLSDSLLDEYLRHDAEARCAFECFAVPNHVILAGEVRSGHELSDEGREEIVRSAIRDIGYEQEKFHWQRVKVQSHIHAQSPEIGSAAKEGAGDQGIMFGYACRETDMLMPAPIYYAHKILRRLSEFRRGERQAGLLPDAKSQISLVYEGGKPKHACSIVVSTQHVADKKEGEIEECVRGVIDGALPKGFVVPNCEILVNPGGSFVMGGPEADAGLTGRKIIVDTYGGAAPHGGGAFSGKDPTKVDRSAAYMARYIAKNIVHAGLSEQCTLQLSYAIGVAKPLSILVNLHDPALADRERKLEALLHKGEIIGLTPSAIRSRLGLGAPIFARTAAYGHFGRAPDGEGGFLWEETDIADDFKAELS